MNIVKNETRLKEINNLLESPDWFKSETHNLLDERNDIQFKLNSQNINFILRGQNKYYYANQCKRFEEMVKLNGYPYIDKEEIKNYTTDNLEQAKKICRMAGNYDLIEDLDDYSVRVYRG